MASELYVETLKGLTRGANANKVIVPAGQTLYAPGHVLQVVQGVRNTGYTTSSTSFVIPDGLSVAITPSSTSSKILITLHATLGATNTNIIIGALYKNGSEMTGKARGSGRSAYNKTLVNYPATDGNGMTQTTFSYLDSPATTSELTYAFAVRASSGSETISINRRTSATDLVTISTITAMEIAG